MIASFLVLTEPSEAISATGAVATAVICAFLSRSVDCRSPAAATGGLLVSEHEAELADVSVLLDEGVTGRPGPGFEILDRARVGRDDLDQLARLDAFDRLRRFENGHGARQAAGVDPDLDVEIAHRFVLS